ncbi:hypothetical protein [Zunongwangia sp. H14]|uniref:hypothetical protein n=1 Tax=Zunongwangia sp. H14 TaxID=3240792 RepID=UPI003564949F
MENKLVIRENYDEEGDFLNKQTFNTGKVREVNGDYELDVLTELFDEKGKSTDKYITTYRCDPSESSIMVMAFLFSKPNSNETEINTTSKNFKELYDLDNLKDIELEMNFDSGLLNFFGSKSTIKIYDRRLESIGNHKQLKSKVNVKAYALGIRIKQLNYTVTEKLNSLGFLTYQKFTENDRSYFTMTYKNL